VDIADATERAVTLVQLESGDKAVSLQRQQSMKDVLCGVVKANRSNCQQVASMYRLNAMKNDPGRHHAHKLMLEMTKPEVGHKRQKGQGDTRSHPLQAADHCRLFHFYREY